jgi:membrane-associated phospholipid phosphatase
VWDFPGATVSVFGRVLAVEGLLRILSVSGLIGFGTNWLAITMLFQPRQKRPIVPQGLIPAQRERVIYRLAQAISQELINERIIKEKIEASGVIGRYREQGVGVLKGVVEDPDFRSDLKALTPPTPRRSSAPTRCGGGWRPRRGEAGGPGRAGRLGGIALRAYRALNEQDFQRRIDQAIREIPAAVEPLLDKLDDALDRVPALVEARSEDIEALATRTVLGFVERLDVYEMIVENARALRREPARGPPEEDLQRAAQLHQVPRGDSRRRGGVRDLGAAAGPGRPHRPEPRALGGGRGPHRAAADRVLGVATASGAVYLIAAGRRAEAVWLLATVAVAFVATFLLKDVFGRARPPAPDDAPGVSSLSFPSAHAALTLVVVGACAVAAAAHARTRLAAIWTALLATVLITTIGASRVYLGVHYPGDVLGGWLLGGLVLAAALVARGVWLPPVKEYGATAPRV